MQGPKVLLVACNRAEPSTDIPGGVFYPGSADIDAGVENLPGARSASESTSNKLSPDFAYSSKAESHNLKTVAAAAAAADIHE